MKILLIEDDVDLGGLLKRSLELEQYNVVWVKSAVAVTDFIDSSSPDIIVLDLSLPKKDGLAVLKDIRFKYQIPIIISTARDTEQSIDDCFSAGADDYIIKPYRVKELILRIQAVYKRSVMRIKNTIDIDDFSLDLDSHRVKYRGFYLELSNAEYLILESLILHPNKIFTRVQLEQKISSLSSYIESNSIEVHIHNIRKKVGYSGIKTIRGLGYKLGRV